MLNQISLKERLSLLTLVFLMAIVGGLMASMMFNRGGNAGVSYVEKITEKQVYLESSSLISAQTKVAGSLVTVVEENKLADLLKMNGEFRMSCLDFSSDKCGLNGVVLTSDGLILLSGAGLGKEYEKKSWVMVDNLGKDFDLMMVGQDQRLGLVLAKAVKRGEKQLSANLRTKLFDFKALAFSGSGNWSVGQQLLLLKNNFLNNSVLLKNNFVGALGGEKYWKSDSVWLDLDERVEVIKLSENVFAEGAIITDLGGLLVGFMSVGEHGNLLITSNEIQAFLSKYEQSPNWKQNTFGLKYSLNSHEKQLKNSLLLDYGVIVDEVNQSFGLSKSLGLKVGDLIIEIDGKSLLDNTLVDLMNQKIVGQQVILSVIRNGKRLELKGTI